jgi:exodeoxyribonuclease VIII
MADLMIDIETVGTGPEACILTIAAQTFDPLGTGYHKQQFYARIDPDSQPDRNIEQGTIDWWATQPAAAQEEAFGSDNRIPLDTALEELGRLIWRSFGSDNRIPLDTALEELGRLIWRSKSIWANGPTFDMNILEHAYKSFHRPLPWQYYRVRDARTVYALYPGLGKPPTSHHALEDCRRQIDLLQATLKHLNIKELV